MNVDSLRTRDFYGREFEISPDVLVPRPETEQMIDCFKSLMGQAILPGVKPPKRRLSKHPRVLDVGTGSGIIAITAKLEAPEAEVVAVDISRPALKIAKRNAGQLGAEVKFLESDLMENVEGEFEVILANLPYVDRSWEWLKEPESVALKDEPEIALYAEDGGLEVIFRLIKQTRGRTKYLVLEADPCQHKRLKEFAKKHGFIEVETRGFQVMLDFFGKV